MLNVVVIFEDEYFLAIDKPNGLVVHSDGRTEEPTLVDWLSKNYPKVENIGNPHTLDSGRYSKRWGIINRLDRETSGIILIAKTEEVFVNLQKQFLDRTVKKEYIAKCFGVPNGLVNVLYKVAEPISRHKKDPRIWVSGIGVGERLTKRDAETSYKILESNEKFSLLSMFPKTGRTHQLRLHTRFLGSPIVGDKKYGINGITNEHSTSQIDILLSKLSEDDFEMDKNSRLMLHAKSLEFLHPVTGIDLKLSSKVPKEFIL